MDKSILQMLKKPETNLNRRWPYYIFFVVLSLLLFYLFVFFDLGEDKIIKVGVLFSQTGTMAETEKPAFRATLMAIEEINAKGGINGNLLVPVVYDGESSLKRHAELATKMIVKDNVAVIFGCFTSASRKAVKDVVEKHDNLLIYPVSYEGVEQSKNIIYLGMTPNQQIIPAIAWMTQNKPKKVYLAGSDYIWPRVSNQIITHAIKSMGGAVIKEAYIASGNVDVEEIDDLVADILRQKPDFIFSTIVGKANTVFLNRLFEKHVNQPVPRIISFGLTPFKDNPAKYKKFAGLYSIWSYYTHLDTPESKAFTEAYQKKYGSMTEIDDPAATSYSGVYLWAQAVKVAPNIEPTVIRDLMLRQSIASPGGPMYIDPINANTWHMVYVARINEQGIDEIVWSSGVPIEAVVYPDFKTPAEWNLFEYQLYINWGNAWERT